MDNHQIWESENDTLSSIEKFCKYFIIVDRALIVRSRRDQRSLLDIKGSDEMWKALRKEFPGKVRFLDFMIYGQESIEFANFLWDLFDGEESLKGCTLFKDEEFDNVGPWSTRKVYGRHKIGPYDQKR